VAILPCATWAADDWGTVGIVSATLGNNAGRLCIGANGLLRPGDFACPSFAPSVTAAGHVSITGNVSANRFIGDGSGLTGIGQGDRIVSGTTNIIASQDRSITATTSGTQRLVIGENGNVGIGRSAPLYPLDVSGSARITTALRIGPGAPSPFYPLVVDGSVIFGNMYLNTYDAFGNRIMDNASNLSIISNNARIHLRNATGNVGINTTSPAATLQVSGSLIVSTSAQNTTPTLFVGTNGNVGVGTSSPVSQFHIRRDNGPVITRLEGVRGAFNVPVSSFDIRNNGTQIASIDANTGNASTTLGQLLFSTRDASGFAERVRIVENGNVGIGTTNPQVPLEVSGSMKLSGLGTEDCNSAAHWGRFRMNPTTGALEICRQ
jgi:hypothetical protein